MIDCFMFNNELDLLTIRLNCFAPYIERFVLCECPVTHSGVRKPLFFEENKAKYTDFNITHLIVDDYPQYMNKISGDSVVEKSRRAQVLENHQRDFLIHGLADVSPETIILLSDMDELIDFRTYSIGVEGSFLQSVYCYYLNVFTGKRNQKGPIAITKKRVMEEFNGSLNNVRNAKNIMRKVYSRRRGWGHGWHFTCLGTTEQIQYKIASCYHQNFNIPEIQDNVEENKNKLLDPYYRDKYNHLTVQEPSGLGWLMQHREEFSHLFYKPN